MFYIFSTIITLLHRKKNAMYIFSRAWIPGQRVHSLPVQSLTPSKDKVIIFLNYSGSAPSTEKKTVHRLMEQHNLLSLAVLYRVQSDRYLNKYRATNGINLRFMWYIHIFIFAFLSKSSIRMYFCMQQHAHSGACQEMPARDDQTRTNIQAGFKGN